MAIKKVAASILLLGALVCSLADAQLPAPPAADELQRLRDENAVLRRQLSIATSRQMWILGGSANEYAADHDGQWPSRPSDLRTLLEARGLEWKMFVAPYAFDRWDREVQKIQDENADPWAWVDSRGSYVFRGGKWGDGQAVVFEERIEFLPGLKWQYMGDAHLELSPPRK